MSVLARETFDFQSAFEALEKREEKNFPSWVRSLRRTALGKFSQIGFPTPREEDWKYTNVTSLGKIPFRFSFDPFVDGLKSKKGVEALILGRSVGQLLVFVNGIYSRALSRIPSSIKGVRAGSLSDAMREHPELVEPHLGKIAPYEQSGFTALNTAFVRDGAFVYLAEGKVAEEPIQLLFIATPSQENQVILPRNLVIAEKGSKATLVEHYISLSSDSYFTDIVTEVVLKEGTTIDHYKLQREGKEHAYHIATTQVRLERDSKYSSFSISLGAKLGRENLNVLLEGEGARCFLNGLYLVSGGRHIDHHTLIDHLKPRGTSRQLYKGIVDGKSTAVFSGKIFVRKDAQKTDAEQTNKTLLLSEEATVDAKPQLEILADDVKCSHGAAVGQLDEDQLFYLKSRGLDSKTARDILTYAFMSEVVSRVEKEDIRSGLDRFLWAWLEKREAREIGA